MPRAIVVLASALAVAAGACSSSRGPTAASQVQTGAAAQDLAVAIQAARVTPEGRVQVDYGLADAAGNPLAGVTDLVASWTLAQVVTDPETSRPIWRSLITARVQGTLGETDQPAAETRGTLEELGGGQYRYTYAAALPQGYDPSATYRAAVYARRPIAGQTGANDVANAVVDFVPAGGAAQPFDAVSTQACNVCHGVLQAHGGFRRDARLCATCHTTQLVDPDTRDTGDPSALNPLDLARLVHRIHSGADLPTVQAAASAGDASWRYHVIGFRGTDLVYAGTAPNRDPTPGRPARVATGVTFPRDLRDCTVCHAPGAGTPPQGAQADAWKTGPSVRACQGCHDDSAFTSASAATPYHHAHPGGLVDADPTLAGRCASCHGSGGGQLDVPTVHVSPVASPAFDALRLTITAVTGPDGSSPVTPDQPVHVAFRLLHGDGSPVTDLAGFQGAAGRVAATIAGPTTDYADVSVTTVTVPAATSATGDYAVDVPFPAGVTPTGTWAAGMEARHRNATLSTATASVYDFARNPVSYFAIGGGAPAPRREIVATDQCNACHGVLSAHGNLRHDTEYCVMCHAPDATDADQRAAATRAGRPIADGLPRRTIHFKGLVHSLHTGEDLQLQRPFVFYGFGGMPAFLDEARFPGTPADCARCHRPGTFTANAVPATAGPTQSVQLTPATVDANGLATAPGQLGTAQPVAAACLSCHDTTRAHDHVAEMGAVGGAGVRESCLVCHGEGQDLSVTNVHAPFTR